MSKQVIIGKCLENGSKRLFLTLEGVSSALGISVATASRAVVGCESVGGWSLRRCDRVFALLVGGEWRVALENGRGNGWIGYGHPEIRYGKRDVEKVRDITIGWYQI